MQTKLQNRTGSAVFVLTLVITGILAATSLIMQAVARHHAKREAAKEKTIEGYYSAEYVAWHNYSRFLSGLDPSGQVKVAAIDNVLTRDIALSTDKKTKFSSSTPLTLSTTAKFDSSATVVRRFDGSNAKYTAPTSGPSQKSICGSINISNETYRTCLSGRWDAPVATLEAAGDPTPGDGKFDVVKGKAANLIWSATISQGCQLNPGNTTGTTDGNGISTGSYSTGPLSNSVTYTLTCQGPGGSATKTLLLNVTTPIDCNSPAAIASNESSPDMWSGNGPWPHYQQYAQLQSQGYQLPAYTNPWYYDGSGANLYNDAATLKASCQMLGYSSGTVINGGPWSSPFDNAVLKWNSGLKTYERLNAGSFNNAIFKFKCSNKLVKECRDDLRWLIAHP